MTTITGRVNALKIKYPEYQNYDFRAFIGGKASVSYTVICPVGDQYTTRISNLEMGRMCGECKKRGTTMLSSEEYDKIMSKVDANGDKLDFTAQNGETWVMSPNDIRSPQRASTISVLCNIHGVISVKISEMLKKDAPLIACKYCNKKGAAKRMMKLEEFVSRAVQIHKNTDGTPIYDYSESVLNKVKNDITIRCYIHGYFTQEAESHINTKSNNGAAGCPDCGNAKGAEKLRLGRDHFIKASQKKHVDKDGNPIYDYSMSYVNKVTGNIEYTNIDDKVRIICPIHGIFKQIAYDHRNGKGCTYCVESEGSLQTWKYLETIEVIGGKKGYKREKKYPDLKYVDQLRFDFYLKKFNALIEFNGEQHYFPVLCWGGQDAFLKRQICDQMKVQYCKDNNIPLLTIKYNDNIKEKIDAFVNFLINR